MTKKKTDHVSPQDGEERRHFNDMRAFAKAGNANAYVQSFHQWLESYLGERDELPREYGDSQAGG